jgi:hypothetical protein
MAVAADYDAQTAVERELVLRLASLLWRLRRATAIESGLFEIQAQHLFQFRRRRGADHEHQKMVGSIHRLALVPVGKERRHEDDKDPTCLDNASAAAQPDDLTRSFVRLTNLPTYPLDRLSRCEVTLWRQTCQILFTLQCLNRRNSWKRILR